MRRWGISLFAFLFPVAGFAGPPFAFEPNRGQAPETVQYLAYQGPQSVYIEADAFTLAGPLSPPSRDPFAAEPRARRPSFGAVRAVFLDAAATGSFEPLDPLPSRSHYLLGDDPAAPGRPRRHLRPGPAAKRG